MDVEELRRRKQAADEGISVAPPPAVELSEAEIASDEQLRALKEAADRQHAEESADHVIALEADAGADVRALMQAGQLKPKHLSRIQLG